jgi:hypothetical protein
MGEQPALSLVRLAQSAKTGEGRQVEGAKVGLAINLGLFGHGSAVLVKS